MVAAVIAAVCACASSENSADLSLDFESDEIRMAVSESVARGVIENLVGSTVDCDGTIDGEFKALLDELDRSGPHARATYRDGETTIRARRRGGMLDLDITGGGSGRIEATMPWQVASCLLGNATTVDDTITSGIRVKVTNPGGRNFSFKMD
jgi:hypothetical protein